jgi:hypothetical protein
MNIENRIESTKKELRYSNLKIWGILFLSSFLTSVWISIYPEIYRSINLMFPLIITMIPWALWTTYQLQLFRPMRSDRHLRDHIRGEFIEFENEHSEQTRKRLFYEYESLMIRLSKQRRVSRLIELLVAVELTLLPLILVYINLLFGR